MQIKTLGHLEQTYHSMFIIYGLLFVICLYIFLPLLLTEYTCVDPECFFSEDPATLTFFVRLEDQNTTKSRPSLAHQLGAVDLGLTLNAGLVAL